MPAEAEQRKWQRIILMMDVLLETKGLKKIAEGNILVRGCERPS
jgi:hypothetical protein